ncbi:hypothetical protein, partial [Escherichia coli]
MCIRDRVNTGRFSRRNFDLASKSLLPWLA